MPLDHTGVIVNKDLFEKTVTWYENALKPIGYSKTIDHKVAVGFGEGKGRADWWVACQQTTNTGTHHAFSVQTRALVDEFHKAAVEAGGTDNGAPGLRPMYHPNYYGAFVRDPAGNNIEAVCHLPEPAI
ncbi:unnamed protein product [Parascedosporium putredinis]|uniref:Glyoxalase/fosfomycin resistance/dioxygenase domain-containing protein n=1 Tax=Parascedosporium putredinis TaxID=1442378 RepID=A0A9P1H225_9PEZI|nr:unnamed protein product [Parascedosporium putredinis]CAI7993592.1 unnamed protein product [Parascedosporium putredinis]